MKPSRKRRHIATKNETATVWRDGRIGIRQERSFGVVNCLFSPDSIDTTNNAAGSLPPGEVASVTTTQLAIRAPAERHRTEKIPWWMSVNLRSAPPRGGISRSSCRPIAGLTQERNGAPVGRPAAL